MLVAVIVAVVVVVVGDGGSRSGDVELFGRINKQLKCLEPLLSVLCVKWWWSRFGRVDVLVVVVVYRLCIVVYRLRRRCVSSSLSFCIVFVVIASSPSYALSIGFVRWFDVVVGRRRM